MVRFTKLPYSGEADIDFIRGSDKTIVNENGNIEVITNNMPPLDYTNGGCPVFNFEPQRTQLIQYSEDFSPGYWNLAGGDKVSGQASPNGDNSAWRIDFNGGAGTFLRTGSIELPANTTYTASWYLKNIDLNDNAIYKIEFFSGGGTGAININVNQSYGTISTTEFTRYSITFTTGDAVGQYRVRVMNGGAINNTNSFIIANAQLEEGSNATSYIPNNGSSSGVTRLADQTQPFANASLIDSEEGVLYVEMAALANDGTQRSISLNNGTTAIGVTIRFRPTSNEIQYLLKDGINANVGNTVFLSDATNYNEITLKWKDNDVAFWVGGIEVSSAVSDVNISGLTNLDFNTFGIFYGKVRDLRVYKSIADAQIDLPYIT